jgi:hypothetical protein
MHMSKLTATTQFLQVGEQHLASIGCWLVRLLGGIEIPPSLEHSELDAPLWDESELQVVPTELHDSRIRHALTTAQGLLSGKRALPTRSYHRAIAPQQSLWLHLIRHTPRPGALDENLLDLVRRTRHWFGFLR